MRTTRGRFPRKGGMGLGTCCQSEEIGECEGACRTYFVDDQRLVELHFMFINFSNGASGTELTGSYILEPDDSTFETWSSFDADTSATAAVTGTRLAAADPGSEFRIDDMTITGATQSYSYVCRDDDTFDVTHDFYTPDDSCYAASVVTRICSVVLDINDTTSVWLTGLTDGTCTCCTCMATAQSCVRQTHALRVGDTVLGLNSQLSHRNTVDKAGCASCHASCSTNCIHTVNSFFFSQTITSTAGVSSSNTMAKFTSQQPSNLNGICWSGFFNPYIASTVLNLTHITAGGRNSLTATGGSFSENQSPLNCTSSTPLHAWTVPA